MLQVAHLNGRAVDAVLVDAGGVLVDPNWELVCELLRDEGVEVDPSLLWQAEPRAKRELDEAEVISSTTDATRSQTYLARVLRHAGVDAPADAVEAASREMNRLHALRGVWEVVPDGAVDALETLRAAGLRVALASNAEPLLRSKLAELGLAQRFDHLGISGEMGVEKPEPAFFARILDALEVAPQRAVHVGDLYEIDVRGARAAGLGAVLVDVADLSTDRDVPRIRSLGELPALLGVTAPDARRGEERAPALESNAASLDRGL